MALSRKEYEDKLIARAMKDPDFRKDLLSNPKEVVEREFGIKLPPNVHLKAVEESENHLYLVLPPMAAANQRALSDDELLVAAAGRTEGWTWCRIIP
jgi:hypothetical protein